ncbi:MAG: uncharacterized membrane protein (UPF0127 family) [Marinobacter maritimus]|jgi:uncharacterized membrane protein (UPF0127 family)|uniref:DUF192 domain-containing protein n=1 Tax=Marinobacter maritimus TaxID=277961 RepID=UPI001FE6088C|nr:DUF192 domain-containing protein [Marinobacter maritimus]|tara:strand:- start:53 stop:547 length:495 start_codon:yes stop_codon:yes gene_type:complete
MRANCALLCLSAMLAGCSAGTGAEEQATGLPVAAGCFVTGSRAVNVNLELAKAPRERQKGLMGREFLAANSGMLFQYQERQGPDHGFWMFQTLIPLDIAYLDRNGVIGNIRNMPPCASSNGARCPSYPAGVEFVSAVEMNAGFFKAHGIAAGDRLELSANNCTP